MHIIVYASFFEIKPADNYIQNDRVEIADFTANI